ncbi:MAG: TRAP transporter small permease subunit [Chromatiales bacterium]|jgi:TRAP-type mannitol/chloroaromatic compound transport system permease small subunit
MEKLIHTLEQINERVGRAVAWLTLFMVLVTFMVVLLRYLFDLGWIAMQESVVYMHGIVFMLGAAYTLKHHGHVRVDIFYQKMSARGRAWVDLLGTLFLLLPVSLFIALMSWEYVADSWAVLEGSREAGGLPGVFLLKSLILLMPLLMLLQGVVLMLQQLLVLRNGEPDLADEDAEERL